MRKLFLALAVASTIVAPVALAADLISDEAAARLAFMREEEKLAHDVYVLFDGLYAGQHPGSKVFGRIAESEQRHTDAVKDLLETYQLVDPAALNGPGVFTDPDLQALYTTLTGIGSESLVQALGIGVLIEEKDMTDIVEAIEVSLDYADIVRVYSNLLAASGNHLEAFEKALDTDAVETALGGDGGRVK